MATASIEENTVLYTLYPNIRNEEKCVDTEAALRFYINECFAKLAIYLTRYIWHNTCFNLNLVNDVKNGAHLQGFTVFDDSVEDEWFIVFLLIELTKMDNELVVTVEDSDGQFLLIEAADSLPKWVKPENSENRVYLYKGAVHIIPLQVSDCTNIVEILRLLRSERLSTKCSEEIQTAIYNRINVFPGKIETMKQKTRCYLPAAITVLLREDPSLISQAVKAFYIRDTIDMKACKAMKHFPPESRVMTVVTLTRCMYSQLMCQKYTPDTNIGWNIPSQNSANFKAYDLGMKISSGFEMLVSFYKQTDDSKANFKFDSRMWNQFINSLERNGYFRNMLKGSKDYSDALKVAKLFFSNITNRHQMEEYCVEIDAAAKIIKILETTEVDYYRLKQEETNLEPEDDDHWMNIEPNDLEALLKRQFNTDSEKDLTRLSSSIPKAMNLFVNFNKSGIEGAEIPIEHNTQNETEEVKFDVDKFGEALSSILQLRVPQSETDESSSGMSDYTEDSSASDDELVLLDKNVRSRKERKACEQSEKAAEENSLNRTIEVYMEAMDRELTETNVGLSFERKKPPLAVQEEDSDDSLSDYAPVDVDLTALTNILKSYESQNGLPGPGSNILNSMGINLPQNSNNS